MTRTAKSQSIKAENREKLRKILIVFIILNSLGFPGKYTQILGGFSQTAMEYLAFGLEILLMMFPDDGDVMSIKLLNLKKKYGAVYFMFFVIFAGSMAVTRYPKEQLITCVRFTTTGLFALWLAETYGAVGVLQLICRAQTWFVGAVLVFMVLKPNSAFVSEVNARDFVGILQTKNNAAAELSCGILLQLALFQISREKQETISRSFIILLAVQGAMLLLCNATGAILCAMLPGIYLLGFKKRWGVQKRLPLGILYIAGSVGFLIAALSILPLFEPLFDSIGKDATLTGRVPLWKQIIKVMTDHHTFLGYGFGMFWRDRTAVALVHSAFSRNSFMGSMSTGAHNVLLEWWMNVGLFGLGSLFLALLSSMQNIKRLTEEQYTFCAAFLLWFLLHGLTERAISPYQYHTLFLFLTMGVACQKPAPVSQRRLRQLERERQK